MIHRKAWFAISGLLSAVGLILTGFVPKASADWSQPYRTLHVGAFAHSIVNKGMSGRRDDGLKQEPNGFSYPQGRSLLVYSGGRERAGWNNKTHSQEGIWIMSNTGGNAQIAFAGTNIEPADIVGLGHDVTTYPEAYLGASDHQDWALAMRSSGGGMAAWTDGPNLANVSTNYWPAKGEVTAKAVPSNDPAIIWNYHYNSYQNGRSFSDRVAAGETGQLGAPSWAQGLSEDDFPDQIGITKAMSTLNNLQWTRRFFMWGSADYDDIVMNDNVVENTGSTTQEGVYIVIKNHFMNAFSTWYEGAQAWYGLSGDRLEADDYIRSTVAPNYLEGTAPLLTTKPAGSARGASLAAQGHAMVYLHDGEQTNSRFAQKDWGDPIVIKLGWRQLMTDSQHFIREGLLTHAVYFGMGVVDAFPPFNTYGGMDTDTYVSPSDNPATPLDESANQPASVTMWDFTSHSEFDQPDPGKDSDQKIYDILTTSGYQKEPDINDAWTEFVAFGPYTLAPGQKAKVVVSYVAGQASHNAKYSDYKKYGRPFEFAWMLLYNGKGGGFADPAARQQEVPLGEDAMFDNFQHALDAYNWGYDIPNQPPNIKGSFESNLNGQNAITWSAAGEDSADPDYSGAEAKDIVGYRVYRGTTENQGPFDLVADVKIADAKAGVLPANVTYSATGVFHNVKTSTYPEGIPLKTRSDIGGYDAAAGSDIPGLYTYTDRESKAGFPNWYVIRTYDSGHSDWKGQGAVPSLESSPGPGGVAMLGATGGVVPVVPSADVFSRFEEKVAVVPNPFKIDDPTHSYKGQQNIRFINLPSRCQIDIYDVTGQRIWTQFLDDLTRGEVTWFQFTEGRPSDFGQAVFPGVYFWKVTSLMPESMNQKQSGTILIMK